ncbi:DUF58 domain-containing protein [Sinomonas halotolerans]|uniref:DUF58 domain-containing protein n=1 Tax=Sinomonas halotolerans TaxID=1644133 RepID=A0ABU9WV10_9MICC
MPAGRGPDRRARGVRDWRGALTRRGWAFVVAAVVVLVAAQVLGRRDLLQLAVFLALVPLAALASNALTRPSLEVRREPRPEVVEAGSATEVTLRLRHSGILAGTLAMAEVLPAAFGQGPAFAYPGRVVGRDGASSYRYELGCRQRGLYRIGPVEARYTDPFGLASQSARLGGDTRLVVTPAAVPLASAVLAGLRGAEGSVPTRMQSSPNDDDVMTREYRPGDPMRRVHWAATARQGELMVRQEESATSPEATLVLDLRHDAFPSGAGPSPSFEWAVTAAMSAAAHLAGLGYSLRLVDTSGSPALASSPSAPSPSGEGGHEGLHDALHAGPRGVAAIAEGLAAIAPTHAADEGDGLADRLLDRLESHRGRGPVVAVLGRTSAAAARSLAPSAATSERALALIVTDHARGSRDAAEILRDAGWQVAEASPRTEVRAAWLALDRDPSALARAVGAEGAP